SGPGRTGETVVEETSSLYELPEGWSYALDAESTPCDADGRYRLAVLPWSLNGAASASARGMSEQRTAIRRAGEPDSVRALDWTLRPDARTTLTVGIELNGGAARGLDGTVTWRGTSSGSARTGKQPLVFAPGEYVLSAVADLAPEHPSAEAVV